MSKCPICDASTVLQHLPQSDMPVDCEVCGKYLMAFEAMAGFRHELTNDVRFDAALSHYVRRRQKTEKCPIISSRDLEATRESKWLPSAKEQYNNLLLWIGDKCEAPGGRAAGETLLYATIGAASRDAVPVVISWLYSDKLISKPNLDAIGDFDTSLTLEGWNEYEKLKAKNVDSHLSFMAMGYGDPEVAKFVSETVKPAVAETGYKLERMDERPEAGVMDHRMQLMIKDAHFVIADITDRNEGAYWEAGYAYGQGKPVFYTCRRAEWDENHAHFDVNHHLTVIWDPEKPEEASELLKAAIRNTIPEAKR